MAENKLKVDISGAFGSAAGTNSRKASSPEPGAGRSKSTSGVKTKSGMFSGLEKRLKLETYFEEGFPVKHLPKILFGVFLSLLYISNTHYADKTTRAINKAQSDVEDLRADFTTLKADVMFASKQSEVARRVKLIGLKESNRPPYKIVVEKGEY